MPQSNTNGPNCSLFQQLGPLVCAPGWPAAAREKRLLYLRPQTPFIKNQRPTTLIRYGVMENTVPALYAPPELVVP